MPKNSLADAVRRAVQPRDELSETDGELPAVFDRRKP